MPLSKIASPCVRHCCLNEKDICLGCFRSLTEIKQWTLVDEKTKLEYIKKSEARKINYKN